MSVDNVLYNILHRSVIAMKDIPAIIKAARTNVGYTQQELGEYMGYSPESAGPMIRSWESGRRPVPLEKIRALASALNLTVDDLVP